jgi:hypothetical protein
MTEALRIFRKDVRHLWPMALVTIVVIALFGGRDFQLAHGFLKVYNSRFGTAEPFVVLIAWWCLAGIVVQQESLVGDRQFWLTRPISRGSILAAKIFFLLAFVSLPSLAAQSVVLAVTGFSPLAWLPSLLFNQVLIATYFGPPLSVAVVTRNFRDYCFASVSAFAVVFFSLESFVRIDENQWGGVEWARDLVVQLTCLTLGVAVLTIQYRSRRTTLARVVIGFFAAILALFPAFGGWRQAFALTAALAREPQAGARVRIAFDPAGGPPSHIETLAGEQTPRARVAFPVQLAGIPPGRQLSSERVSATIQAPGSSWTSGWTYSNEVAGRTVWRNIDDWLAQDGRYWLSVSIPAAWYQKTKEQPVDLYVRVAFSLFSDPQATMLPPRPQMYFVPDVGLCTMETITQSPNPLLGALMPFQRHVAAEARVQPRDGGAAWRASSCCMMSYAPVPAAGTFSVWADTGFMPAGPEHFLPDDMVSIATRRPLAHFERDIEIRQIRLARYEVGITQ